MRSREDELNRGALQQKMHEEYLQRREKDLVKREIDLVERELNILLLQQGMSKPTPKKRKGKFRASQLKLLRQGRGKNISEPSGGVSFLIAIKSCIVFRISFIMHVHVRSEVILY